MEHVSPPFLVTAVFLERCGALSKLRISLAASVSESSRRLLQQVDGIECATATLVVKVPNTTNALPMNYDKRGQIDQCQVDMRTLVEARRSN